MKIKLTIKNKFNCRKCNVKILDRNQFNIFKKKIIKTWQKMVTLKKKKSYLLIESINKGKYGEKIQNAEFSSTNKNHSLNFR